MRKFYLRTLGFFLIIFFTFSLGFYSAGWLEVIDGESFGRSGLLKKTEVTNGEPLDLSLLWQVLNLINENYLRKEEIKASELLYGAVSGLVASLGDPYTSFYSPQENKAFQESLEGIYQGIGAQLGFRDSQLVIVAPLDGGPAEEAGIRPGDAILAVDEEKTVGWSLAQAVEKIRGEEGTKVVLTLAREDQEDRGDDDQDGTETFNVTIERRRIKVPNVVLEWKEAGSEWIAYLKIFRFGPEIGEDWGKAVQTINNRISDREKVVGVIVDLRNNPGGYLEGAILLGREFFSDGILVKRKSADGSVENFEVKTKGRLVEVPVVVLVNEGSASASEILAGAIKIRGRGKLVGEKTFGKGTVQEAFDLPEGAGIHITNAEWLLPDGSSIDEEGLEVDVKIEFSDEDVTAGKDPQLEKALELLSQNQ